MTDGTWISNGRKALGLSQAELAATLGAKQSTVSQWETGKKAPTVADTEALRALFGAAAATAPAATAPAPSKP